MDNNMENNDSLIELIDENGEAVNFEHLMTIEHEGEYYIVLTAADQEEETEDGEVIILKVEKDENDEDCYVTIEDEDLLQAVFDKFVAAVEEEDDDAAFAPADDSQGDEE